MQKNLSRSLIKHALSINTQGGKREPLGSKKHSAAALDRVHLFVEGEAVAPPTVLPPVEDLE